MSRPAVSVVMPFAGSAGEAATALGALGALAARDGDQLILVDNRGSAPAGTASVDVVTATAEHSPAYARNIGAEHAIHDWILFLDADTEPLPDLLDRFFAAPVDDDVGAVAGAVLPAAQEADGGAASSYGATKSFLDLDVHLAHPFMPRAVAANLLVRRVAFEQIGGFFEGVRAAEDTDFSWRLQRAGWRLDSRPAAAVRHRYRTSVRALRRQWRGYAAGRAWLARRYDGFDPQPALTRAASRVVRRGSPAAPPAAGQRAPSRGHFAIDALLGVEELAGFALSNRPRDRDRRAGDAIRVVLVADRFPARGDPLVDYALTLSGARVEAGARPEAVSRPAARALVIDYREDAGVLTRAVATAWLVLRHPVRCLFDAWRRPSGAPGVTSIAPAVARLRSDRGARVHPLGGDDTRALAARLAALAGRDLD